MESDATSNIATKHGEYDALCTQMLEGIVQYKILGAYSGAYEAKFGKAIDIIRSDTLKQTLFNIGYHIFINFIFPT